MQQLHAKACGMLQGTSKFDVKAIVLRLVESSTRSIVQVSLHHEAMPQQQLVWKARAAGVCCQIMSEIPMLSPLHKAKCTTGEAP